MSAKKVCPHALRKKEYTFVTTHQLKQGSLNTYKDEIKITKYKVIKNKPLNIEDILLRSSLLLRS